MGLSNIRGSSTSATRISCQSSGVSVRASSGDATLTQGDAFCGSCYPDPGKPPEARALLVSGLSSARINEAGLPSWPESGRKIYDNMKGALACYCLRRAHDETGQRAGLRRHGEPLGGLLCVGRHGSHCHPGCARGRGRALWVAPCAAVAAGLKRRRGTGR